jgi:vacuolar-type H+-ATPase subunit H
MATQEPGREQPALTPLPRVEDLPTSAQGYDQDRVREAFDAFRRHVTQLQAQLRVFQAARGRAEGEPTGHAVRMDALHIIRAAAEFADTMEQDAQDAVAKQIKQAESQIGDKHRELVKHETRIEQLDREQEAKRNETLSTARAEAQEMAAKAEREASERVKEAEASAARLLEQARHQATELTNSARAEIDRSLEWARSEAGEIHTRARQGAEQLLAAAGLTGKALEKVVDAVVGTVGGRDEETSKPSSTSSADDSGSGGQSAG